MRKSILFIRNVCIITCFTFSLQTVDGQTNTRRVNTTPSTDTSARKTVNPTINSGELANMPKLGSEPPRSECEAALPSIFFPGQKTVNPTQPKAFNALTNDAVSSLQKSAAIIKANPSCRVKVTGYSDGTKNGQQLSWDRVNLIIKYLVEKAGISGKRFIFEYGSQGDPNTVDLTLTTEDGPPSVPAPHPNLRTIGL